MTKLLEKVWVKPTEEADDAFVQKVIEEGVVIRSGEEEWTCFSPITVMEIANAGTDDFLYGVSRMGGASQGTLEEMADADISKAEAVRAQIADFIEEHPERAY